VRVADHEAGLGRFRQGQSGLEPRTASNIKCRGRFHLTTLGRWEQIFKGG